MRTGWLVGLVVLVGCAAGGCAAKRPGELPVYPVKGRATYKGAPMSGAVITFFPAGQPAAKALKSRAYADKDGYYELTTYELKDGAPEGEYAAVLWWPDKERGPDDLETGSEVDRLRRAYDSPEKPKLRFTVKPEPNTIDITLP
jgi:hypothetical protein